MRALGPIGAGSILVALFASLALGSIDIPATGKRVVDTAGLLTPATIAHLEGLLAELESKTTDQVKVLTVPTTGDEDIFSFAQRTYTNWKLGTKDKSNGALIVLAVKDRKVRIHTGYGLEGSLPDQWIGTLSRATAQEYFRRGRYPEGLEQMTLAVVNKLAADAGVEITGLSPSKVMPPSARVSPLRVLLLLVPIIVLLIYISYTRRGLRGGTFWGDSLAGGLPWGSSVGPWTSSGGWGGSFDGGSFGGGGGSFGGGGSSGGGGGGASW